MAAGDVLIGIGAVIGGLGTVISAVALLRNGKEEDDLDRSINRAMKLKILHDLENEDEGKHGRADIIFTPIRLWWEQWRMGWARW